MNEYSKDDLSKKLRSWRIIFDFFFSKVLTNENLSGGTKGPPKVMMRRFWATDQPLGTPPSRFIPFLKVYKDRLCMFIYKLNDFRVCLCLSLLAGNRRLIKQKTFAIRKKKNRFCILRLKYLCLFIWNCERFCTFACLFVCYIYYRLFLVKMWDCGWF